MNYRNVPLKYTHAKQKDLRHTKSIKEMWIFSSIDISLLHMSLKYMKEYASELHVRYLKPFALFF